MHAQHRDKQLRYIVSLVSAAYNSTGVSYIRTLISDYRNYCYRLISSYTFTMSAVRIQDDERSKQRHTSGTKVTNKFVLLGEKHVQSFNLVISTKCVCKLQPDKVVSFSGIRVFLLIGRSYHSRR